MIKFAPLAMLVAFTAFSLVPLAAHAGNVSAVRVAEGKMVYAANGQRLAPVYRVNTDGSVQFIMEGRLVTIPATLLTDVNGKLISSESRGDLLR